MHKCKKLWLNEFSKIGFCFCRKLAQMRCEIVQRIFKKSHLDEIVENEDCDSTNVNDEFQTEVTKCLANGTNNDIEQTKSDEPSRHVSIGDPELPEKVTESSLSIPDILVPELIERVRIATDLNHNICALTVKTVIECIGEMIPSWNRDCQTIIQKLSANLINPIAPIQSTDMINLKAVFKRLWYCKNDEQQRSWPVHEDEELITNTLDELLQILANANLTVSREAVCRDNYDNLHMLVTYFQMETRRSIKMKLYSVFISLISMFEDIIPNYLLSSVLPAELAAEMQNYVNDEERWQSAALLFTAIFSTGHKPPINIYEHINEKFLGQLYDIVEKVDADGNRFDCNISPESSIAPILAFNLHLDVSGNMVLKALKKRRNASQLTENLVSHLNWEEDITRISGTFSDAHLLYERPNAVLKFLIEMFTDAEVAKLFYLNDIKVVIDIIIRQLNNLPFGDKVSIPASN